MRLLDRYKLKFIARAAAVGFVFSILSLPSTANNCNGYFKDALGSERFLVPRTRCLVENIPILMLRNLVHDVKARQVIQGGRSISIGRIRFLELVFESPDCGLFAIMTAILPDLQVIKTPIYAIGCCDEDLRFSANTEGLEVLRRIPLVHGSNTISIEYSHRFPMQLRRYYGKSSGW